VSSDNLHYLQGTVQSPHLRTVRHFTSLRLESELYQLTLVGGPRYLPRSVNHAAFATLGQLFPRGHRNRRFISW
jgi:hypothetical protein